jgi:hypothetical protein
MKIAERIVFVGLLSFSYESGLAQPIACDKLAECGQRLVEIANRLQDENKRLADRIAALESLDIGSRLAELETKVNGLLKGAPSKTFPDESKTYASGDNNKTLALESAFDICAISYYPLAAGEGGQCGVIREDKYWRVRVSGSQYCRVTCYKLGAGK